MRGHRRANGRRRPAGREGDLYEFVRRAGSLVSARALSRPRGKPVTRDEAAAHAGISRRLAAFHLDKLVRGGLLTARTDLPAARVGRRPKVYEPSQAELTVSVPARQYDLLAELLLDAVNETDQPEHAARPAGEIVAAAAHSGAHHRGEAAGAAVRDSNRAGRLGPERALTLAARVLEAGGYEPARPGPRHLVLRNCPFHRLAERSRELVCSINHAFCAGVVDGLDAASAISADLDPVPGLCCVQLHGR
jgi:predicted ArsR family transcriptional regulator